MFLRATIRRKDGKEHRYWSLVENKRVSGGRVVQRHVLYLGEINSSQELAWRKSIEVLEDGGPRGGGDRSRTLALFPEDRCEGVLADSSIVRLKLSQLRLRRPRQWGACWLALKLWEELRLDRFWAERLAPSRKGTRWDQVLLVLVAYRLIAPGAEWHLHREWYGRSALADLLGAMPACGQSQALPLPRPAAGAQAAGIRSSGGALAGSVQRLLRRAAVRPDEHLLRGQSTVFRGRQAPPRLTGTSCEGV
jgi:hypothetical protein